MTSRDAFLQRVRQAATEGNRTGSAAPLPDRGSIGVGFEGTGTALVEKFSAELARAGGTAQVVASPEEMFARTLDIINARRARHILLAPVAFDPALAQKLRGQGLEVTPVEDLTLASCREPFFRADLGLTGAMHLIAETGSVVVASSPPQPRSASLLPPIHVVLAQSRQILPDLFDLFARFETGADKKLPSCLTVITGPSKTGDIELKLVTGVHGPGELHVIIGTWN